MTKASSKKLLTIILVFCFLAISLFATIFIFAEPKEVYAEEIVDTVRWNGDECYPSDWYSGIARVSNVTVNIIRTSKNHYKITGSISLNKKFGSYYLSHRIYVDNSAKIEKIEFYHSDKNATSTSFESNEFEHKDTVGFKIKWWAQRKEGALGAPQFTSMEKTIKAYDNQAPTIILDGVKNGEKTNTDVIVTASDNKPSSFIRYSTDKGNTWTSPNKSNFTFSNDGSYEIQAYDGSDNTSSTYTFEIDKTAPEGTFSGVDDGGITNGDVSFSWTQSDDTVTKVTATLNGEPYISGTSIEGKENDIVKYTIVLSEKFYSKTNKKTYNFTIDKRVPNFDIKTEDNNSLQTGLLTNKSVYLSIFGDFKKMQVYRNNTLYIDNYRTTYYYDKKDTINKQILFNQLYKKQDSTKQFGKYISGPVATEDVSFSAQGKDCWLYDNLYFFREETLKKYITNNTNSKLASIYYYDDNDNIHKIFDRQEIFDYIYNNEDSTKQFGKYTSGPVATEDVSFSAQGKDCWLYDNLYFFREETLKKYITANTNSRLVTIDKWLISEEGNYRFVCQNYLETTVEKTVIIDKTAPEGTLSGVDDGGITNGNVAFSWLESGATATLNGQPYNKGDEITTSNGTEKKYTLILKDIAGNTRTYTFTIDRLAPTGTLSGVENGGITNKDVSFSWLESGATATLNGQPYKSGDIISETGEYKIIITDKYGNTRPYTFTIDKIKPTGTLNGVENSGITNSNVSFNWAEEGATATLNGEPYTSGESITNEGRYEIVLTDAVGNPSTYTFEIDKTPPKGTLNGVENGGITNGTVSFSWTESRATATLNGESYISGTSIRLDTNTKKDYKIVLTDTASNKTEYTFTINKILPTLSFTDGNSNLNVIAKEKFFLNKDIYITCPSSLKIVINGEVIKSIDDLSDTIYTLSAEQNQEVTYTIEITNQLGNKNTYIVCVDKKAPVENLEDFLSKGFNYKNHWYETYQTQLISGKYTPSQYFSFATFAEAKNYAMKREGEQFEKSTYDGSGKIWCQYAQKYVDGFDIYNPKIGQSYTIYKDANNENRLVAYFDNANLLSAQNNHSHKSIKEKFVPGKPNPEYTANTVFINEIFIKGSEFTLQYKPTNTDLYYSHSPSASESQFTKIDYNKATFTAGYTRFMEIDKAGNKVYYTIYLDNVAPQALAYDADGNYLDDFSNLLNEGRSKLYYTEVFTLSISDTLDDNAILVIKQNGELKRRIFAGEGSEDDKSYTFDTSGIYELVWYDKVGNQKSTTLYLALEEIECTFNQILDDSKTVIGFEMLLDKKLSFNSIVNISIDFTDLEGNTFELNSSTEPQFIFNKDTFKYSFYINGTYSITITDEFGRNTFYEYILQKGLPVGKIFDKATNKELTNNTIIGGPVYSQSGQGIYFDWEDTTLSCVYSINGGEFTEYISKTLLGGILGQNTLYQFKLSSSPKLTSTFSITIDLTPIKIILEGVEEFGATNKNVNLSWDSLDKGKVSVKYNNQGYSNIKNNTTFEKTGNYAVRTVDVFGNSYYFEFIIDKDSPIAKANTVNGQEIKKYTNRDFYFEWGGENVTATLNGVPYDEKEIISEDGIYNLIIVDYLGNSNSIQIIRDTVINSAIFTGLNNNNYSNSIVTAIWSDNDITATLNGQPYNKGDEITTLDNTATVYTLILKDIAGNKLEYTFTIDKVLPKGTLSGVENKGITKSNVSFSWTNSIVTATLNGEPYISGTSIKAEGGYVIEITNNRSNNKNIYTFEIDKTAPTGTLSGVENGGITNNNVTFTWTEEGATATLNGKEYIANNIISETGNYTLILKDIAGNKTEYSFTIDKKAPKGTLSGVENGGTTKSNVTFTWTESRATATLNGEQYISGTLIKDSNLYEIVLTDAVGNSTIYTFTIDKNLPSGIFFDEADNIITNITNLYNFNIYFKFDDVFTATLNGEPYTSDTLITEENQYEIKLSNFLNNYVLYTFEIDKTAPKGTLSGVENKGITNKNVIFTWTESRATAYISKNNTEKIEYVKDSIISKEGFYTIYLYDRAGNESIFNFTIIKEKPFALSYGLNDYNMSNSEVYWTINESFTATLNAEEYISGTIIDTEGDYTLVVYNLAGDNVEYTFSIDKTAPTITIKNKLDELILDKTINMPFKIFINEEGEVVINEEKYSGKLITQNNSYIIIATDKAGNSSYIKIDLNNIPPKADFNTSFWNNQTANDVIVWWTEEGATATLNGKEYIANNIISETGNYILILTNKYGASSTYSFTIDKTPPAYTLKGVENGGITNNNVSIDFNSNFESYIYIKDNPDSYMDYIPGKSISCAENSIAEYVVEITNKLGASVTLTFTIDKILPIGELTGVENGGITNGNVTFTWTEDGATATLNGEEYISGNTISIKDNSKKKFEIILIDSLGNLNTYTFTINKILPLPTNQIPTKVITKDEFSIKFAPEYTATLNEQPYKSGDIISETGEYTFKLSDELGNTSIYQFIIDKTILDFTVNMNDEDIVVNKDKQTFNYAISIFTDLKFTVNGIEQQSGYTLSTIGTYEVVVYSQYGLSKTYTIVLTPPDSKIPTKDIIVYIVIGLIACAVITTCTVLIIKTIKHNKKKII